MLTFVLVPISDIVLWQVSHWGGETHTITLAGPDVFSYYGLLSGGLYKPDEIKDKSKVKLIFMSCGSFENPDVVRKATDSLKGLEWS